MSREPNTDLVPRGRFWATPLVRRLWKKLLWTRFRMFHRHRYDSLVVERVGDLSLIVLPSVFNPGLLWTGGFMRRELAGDRIPPGSKVLDLGCGTGIGALLAAPAASHIVAADVNPAALRCARINALLHDLEEKIEVVESDLFSALEGRRFDVVLFNPPFFRGTPKSELDRAWRSEGLFERFAEALPEHLGPGGCAWVVFSAEGDTDGLLAAFRGNGLDVELVAQEDRINEVLILYRVRVAPGGVRS